ncbi:putative protease Do-like 14 isoform X2 [Rutidosis leptorrhynchoides]
MDSVSVASNDSNKDTSGEVGGGSKSIADAAADVLPALVYITLSRNRGKAVHTIAGSGTIIDPNGTILTCAHLFSSQDGKEVALNGKVNVTLQDGRSFVGTILNTDIHYDVALVKIDATTPFPAAKLGSSCKLRPGDSVLALGSPLGLKNTVTAGIVSCVNRESYVIGLGGMLRHYIQTDCALYHGNSGGPLVNLYGEVIGVNVMGCHHGDYNFAVPVDSILKIMDQFKKNGTVIRPWLGMKMVDLDEIRISQLIYRNPKFPSVTKGVLVVMVVPGSPADVAGICPGDVVVKFQGKSVGSISQITTLMGDEVGKPFKVVVKRAAETLRLTMISESTNPEIQ